MPKHYRRTGKKMEVNAVRKLYIHTPVPRKMKTKEHHYPSNDIAFPRHDKPVHKFRYLSNILQRYPKFVDALRDLDDCLCMIHLFAALPASQRENIPASRVHTCRRLSHEWQSYISRTHKLRKTFISVKGIYYQAEVEGQKITWLTPHALQQVWPDDVDYNFMLKFLELHELLLVLVLTKLYQSIHLKYPPILDPQLEALSAELFSLSKILPSNGSQFDESKLRLSQLQQQLPSSEASALMNLVGESTDEDHDDEDTKLCKSLFKNMRFFLSREVPRESLLFVLHAFGGMVSWEGEGGPFNEADESITHQIVDRPTQDHIYLSRDYVQQQWVYDCINAKIIMPNEGYMVGRQIPKFDPILGSLQELAEIEKAGEEFFRRFKLK